MHHLQIASSRITPNGDIVGDCDTPLCILVAGIDAHTWTLVGNRTHDGKFDELQFLQIGEVMGHENLA
jgi:hypothetical protein